MLKWKSGTQKTSKNDHFLHSWESPFLRVFEGFLRVFEGFWGFLGTFQGSSAIFRAQMATSHFPRSHARHIHLSWKVDS